MRLHFEQIFNSSANVVYILVGSIAEVEHVGDGSSFGLAVAGRQSWNI